VPTIQTPFYFFSFLFWLNKLHFHGCYQEGKKMQYYIWTKEERYDLKILKTKNVFEEATLVKRQKKTEH